MIQLPKFTIALCSTALLATGCGEKKKGDTPPQSQKQATAEKKAKDVAPAVKDTTVAKVAPASGPLSEEELAWTSHCATALSGTAEEPTRVHWVALVTACGMAVGTDKLVDMEPNTWLSYMVANTDLACRTELAESIKSVGKVELAAHLVKECGAAYYGLTDANAGYMSMGWYTARLAGQWLSNARSRLGTDDAKLAEEVDNVFANFQLRMPLPRTSAPAANLPQSAQYDAVESLNFVLVGDAIQVAAMPTVKLSEEGPILQDNFPTAATVELGALVKALDGLEPVKASFTANTEGPSWLQPASDNAPLLLAAGTQTAAKMLAVAQLLGKDGAHFAVTPASEAHPDALGSVVTVGRVDASKTRAVSATIELGDGGLTITTNGKSLDIPRKDGAYDLSALQSKLDAPEAPPEGGLVITASGNATYQELVSVLDTLAEAGFRRIGTIASS